MAFVSQQTVCGAISERCGDELRACRNQELWQARKKTEGGGYYREVISPIALNVSALRAAQCLSN